MTEKELLLKAKEAKSPEELLNIARASGMTDFTEENARAYFNVLNQHGELADEEIDAAGGGCAYRAHGQKMVTTLNGCSHWRCNRCNNGRSNSLARKKFYAKEDFTNSCHCVFMDGEDEIPYEQDHYCMNCYYCSYEHAAWWCNNDVHYYE